MTDKPVLQDAVETDGDKYAVVLETNASGCSGTTISPATKPHCTLTPTTYCTRSPHSSGA